MRPEGPYCQRWRDHRHSYQHPSHGGFDRRDYRVEAISEADAKAFICQHHYAHSLPATRLRYGLYERGSDELVGVSVLSVPVQAKVLSSIFPGLEPYAESLELGRFCLLDQVPANAESYFLARCFDQAAEAGVRGIVSFSDPLPRHTANGDIVMPGHVGIIYQASNAVYTGRGTPRSLLVLPDGTVMNARAMQKIRAGETGTEYAQRQLVALGAAPLGGDDPAAWLARALRQVGARRLRHQGNHRYAFAIGRDRRERRAVRIALPPLGYPKQADAA